MVIYNIESADKDNNENKFEKKKKGREKNS